MEYRIPVCVRDEYTIRYELLYGLHFMHCDVVRWSASIARRMNSDMDALQGLLGSSVYAVNEPSGCLKHQKFMRLMGFKQHGHLAAMDGGVFHVFKR